MISGHQDEGREGQAPQPVVILEVSQLVCYSEVSDVGGWLEEFNERMALIRVPSYWLPLQCDLTMHHIFRASKQHSSTANTYPQKAKHKAILYFLLFIVI